MDVSIQVSGLNLVNKLGQTNVVGEGHIHYFMDAIPPVFPPDQPAVTAAGTYVDTTDTSYTWPNVEAGLHVFSAGLVNNDHTPLNPPIVASVLITVQTAAGAAAVATASPTATITPSPTATATPSPAAGGVPYFTMVGSILMPAASPSPTVSPTTTTTASPSAMASSNDVTINVQVSNFTLVDKLGQANVAGQGHLHYFLDAIPPTTPNLPAVTAPGTYAATADTTYTWRNVQPGTHMFSVEVINNDHTPLDTPVTTSIIITIPGVAATATTAASPASMETVSPSPSPTSTASPIASAVTISLTAQGNAFDKSTITVPSGVQVTINFNNMDNGIAHNFSVYTDQSANTPIFIGQYMNGPGTITYTFPAPNTPGNYFFRCDVHPTLMTGIFVVQ